MTASKSLLLLFFTVPGGQAFALEACATATPSVVSVCTAELCSCQKKGGSAEDILNDLKSRGLPYPVEEAPCLGACGGGAMVAIDFEDGSAVLVSGLDELLSELGLEEVEATLPKGSCAKMGDQFEAEATPSGSVRSKIESEDPSEISYSGPRPPEKASRYETRSGDARDRMRAMAANDPERENPWVNLAGYLAGKAQDKILGK